MLTDDQDHHRRGQLNDKDVLFRQYLKAGCWSSMPDHGNRTLICPQGRHWVLGNERSLGHLEGQLCPATVTRSALHHGVYAYHPWFSRNIRSGINYGRHHPEKSL
jgi:hypothetical protein